MKIEDVKTNGDFLKWLSDYYDGKVIKGRQEQIGDFLKQQSLDADQLQKVLTRFRRAYTQASYPACGVIEDTVEFVAGKKEFRKPRFIPRKGAIDYIQHKSRNYGPRQVYKLCKTFRENMTKYGGNPIAMSILWLFDVFEHNVDCRAEAGLDKDVIGELAQRDFDAIINGEPVEDAAVTELKDVPRIERKNRTMGVDALVDDIFPVYTAKSYFV